MVRKTKRRRDFTLRKHLTPSAFNSKSERKENFNLLSDTCEKYKITNQFSSSRR